MKNTSRKEIHSLRDSLRELFSNSKQKIPSQFYLCCSIAILLISCFVYYQAINIATAANSHAEKAESLAESNNKDIQKIFKSKKTNIPVTKANIDVTTQLLFQYKIQFKSDEKNLLYKVATLDRLENWNVKAKISSQEKDPMLLGVISESYDGTYYIENSGIAECWVEGSVEIGDPLTTSTNGYAKS